MNTIETIKLDRVPKGKMPVLHASQYDNGRTHGIDLTNLGEEWKLDGTETLTINERKVDNNICSMDIENTFTGSSHIVFASFLQMCACAGSNFCELRISKGDVDLGTLNFILEVEPDPTADGIESESEIRNLKTQVEAITEEVIGDDYYTKTQTDEAIATAIEGKADASYVDTELAKKADKTDTYTKMQVDTALNGKADKDTTYTKTQVDSEISRLDGKIDSKANASDVYTKSQTDNLLNDKANSDDVYDKTYIDTALSGKANVGTSYTKSEEDALLANKADKSDTYTKEQVDDIVYNIMPDDTASGSVANFDTSLELPIKSLEVDVNAVQVSGTPTPSTPLPISGASSVKVIQRGANLFDKDTMVIDDAYINDTDGTQRSNTGDKCTDYIEIAPNTTYYIVSEQTSGKWGAWYDENKAFISGINQYGTKTSPANAKYMRLTVVRQGNGNPNTVSINYPSSDTTYHAYNGNTEAINLGGTYYGGHFTQDKAGHRQFVATHEYETDMGQYNYTYVSASNCFRTTNFNKAYKRTNYSIIANSLCSHYGGAKLQEVLNQSANNSTYAFGIVGLYNGSVLFRNTNYSDATAFKSSMQGVTMTFELETPIIIDLPDGEPIATLIGTNNIFADSGDTSVVFKCSVNDYINAHSGGGLRSLGNSNENLSKGGGEEEPKEESEEPKEVTKTLGDDANIKKIGGE